MIGKRARAPGGLGGTVGQREDLRGGRAREGSEGPPGGFAKKEWRGASESARHERVRGVGGVYLEGWRAAGQLNPPMDAGQPATAPVIEGPATANELVSAPHDFTHVRDCGHPTVCRRGGRIRMRRPRRQTASAIRAGLLRQGAATPPPRRHSSAAPAWLPPAMSPPAAAPSRRRQHCSDSSLCCPGAAAATSVTATSAAAISVAMAAAAARRASEELHVSVCVWRLWRGFRFSGETPGISNTKRASCLP